MVQLNVGIFVKTVINVDLTFIYSARLGIVLQVTADLPLMIKSEKQIGC